MPRKFFVTRHAGAVQWASEAGLGDDVIRVEDLDPEVVDAADTVIGTLPVQLVAQVNRRGARYWHLSMTVPEVWRGKELTAAQMREFGARLEEVSAVSLGERPLRLATPVPAGGMSPRVHVCIASGQTLPNLLPLLLLEWDFLLILASAKMKARALRLRALAARILESRGSKADCIEIVDLPGRETHDAMQPFAAGLSSQLASDRWNVDINLTGGLLVMSLPFSDAFSSFGRRLYCNTEYEVVEVVDAVVTPALPMPADLLDLRTYLQAQGYAIARCQTADDEDWLDRLKWRRDLTSWLVGPNGLRAERNDHTLTEFTVNGVTAAGLGAAGSRSALAWMHRIADAARGRRRPDRTFRRRPRLEVRVTQMAQQRVWRDLLGKLADFELVEGSRLGPAGVEFRFVDNEAAEYVAGGFLEEFAFLAVHDLGLPRAHYAANIGLALSEDGKSVTHEVNEADVLVVWRNRLLVLECKAGSQLTVPSEIQNVLNKLDRLRQYAGGTFGRGWLLAPLELRGRIRDDVEARLAPSGLKLLDGAANAASLGERLKSELRVE